MSAQEILMEHSPDLQNSDWEELWETRQGLWTNCSLEQLAGVA